MITDYSTTAIDKAYKRSRWLYKRFWGLGESGAMNFGFWYNVSQKPAVAQKQLFAALSKMATIPRQANWLDVGSGYGGGAFYLVQQLQANVTCINVSAYQQQKVQLKAQKLKLADRINTIVASVTEADLPVASFEGGWAIESLFHLSAADKEVALQRIFTALAPGATFTIADYFADEETSNEQEQKLLYRWKKGFKMPVLWPVEQWHTTASAAGFEFEKYTDVTERVRPGADKLAALGAKAFQLLRFVPGKWYFKTESRSLKAMGQALNAHLWQYGVLQLKKPL